MCGTEPFTCGNSFYLPVENVRIEVIIVGSLHTPILTNTYTHPYKQTHPNTHTHTHWEWVQEPFQEINVTSKIRSVKGWEPHWENLREVMVPME